LLVFTTTLLPNSCRSTFDVCIAVKSETQSPQNLEPAFIASPLVRRTSTFTQGLIAHHSHALLSYHIEGPTCRILRPARSGATYLPQLGKFIPLSSTVHHVVVKTHASKMSNLVKGQINMLGDGRFALCEVMPNDEINELLQ